MRPPLEKGLSLPSLLEVAGKLAQFSRCGCSYTHTQAHPLMPFLIVPNEAFGDTATIWVGAIDENFDPAVTVLEYGSNQIPLNANWIDYPPGGQGRIRYQRVPLSNLQPRTLYDLVLRIGGVARADGIVTTIPYRLTSVGEPPFIVFLGSCFYVREDPS